MTEQITAVPAVRRARPSVVLETVKYTVKYARVPFSPSELRLPAPRVDLDDVDLGIIHALVRDGRQSNRAIAGQFNVSEGTIRARRRRLEDAGLLRIVGHSDPYLTRLVNVWAFIGVDVEGGTASSVSQQLAAMTEVLTVAIITGRHDLLVAVAAVSRTRLVELVVEDIRSIAGVQATETWEIARTFRFNYQWARLV
jgi:DNA-binding Lrp family transcriptional regulator